MSNKNFTKADVANAALAQALMSASAATFEWKKAYAESANALTRIVEQMDPNDILTVHE